VLSFVSVFPALLAVPMLLLLKEPEAWIRAKAEASTGGSGKAVGSIADLFRHPRWRRSTLVGVCLGVAGMVGLWGIAFFSPELITTAFKNRALQIEEVLKPLELCAAMESPANPAISRIRAIEHGRSIVHISTVGVSALITPDGTLHQPSTLFTPAVLAADLPLRTEITLADRVGPWPEDLACACVAGMLALLALGRIRRRR